MKTFLFISFFALTILTAGIAKAQPASAAGTTHSAPISDLVMPTWVSISTPANMTAATPVASTSANATAETDDNDFDRCNDGATYPKYCVSYDDEGLPKNFACCKSDQTCGSKNGAPKCVDECNALRTPCLGTKTLCCTSEQECAVDPVTTENSCRKKAVYLPNYNGTPNTAQCIGRLLCSDPANGGAYCCAYGFYCGVERKGCYAANQPYVIVFHDGTTATAPNLIEQGKECTSLNLSGANGQLQTQYICCPSGSFPFAQTTPPAGNEGPSTITAQCCPHGMYVPTVGGVPGRQCVLIPAPTV